MAQSSVRVTPTEIGMTVEGGLLVNLDGCRYSPTSTLDRCPSPR